MSLGCGLGRIYDIVPLAIPIDLDNSQTGDIFELKHWTGFDLHIFTGDGAAGRDVQFDVKRHTDISDGTGTTIALGSATALRKFHYKEGATTVVGDTGWTTGTWFDADGAGVILNDAEGENSSYIVVPFEASDLGDGYTAVSISAIVAGGSGAKIGCAFALLRDPQVQRAPANLDDPTT